MRAAAEDTTLSLTSPWSILRLCAATQVGKAQTQSQNYLFIARAFGLLAGSHTRGTSSEIKHHGKMSDILAYTVF